MESKSRGCCPVILLWVKHVEFRLKPCKTWRMKHQKFVKQTGALFDLSSNLLQQYSWLYYALSFTVGAGSITGYLVLLKTELFLMYVLMDGLRGNLREELQRCFMNAFSCMFNLAKLKCNDLHILHFSFQIIKPPNSSVISWHEYVQYWHACMSLASMFTFWILKNRLQKVNKAFISLNSFLLDWKKCSFSAKIT